MSAAVRRRRRQERKRCKQRASMRCFFVVPICCCCAAELADVTRFCALLLELVTLCGAYTLTFLLLPNRS
jgi:hypothetical protein